VGGRKDEGSLPKGVRKGRGKKRDAFLPIRRGKKKEGSTLHHPRSPSGGEEHPLAIFLSPGKKKKGGAEDTKTQKEEKEEKRGTDGFFIHPLAKKRGKKTAVRPRIWIGTERGRGLCR